MTVLGVTGGIGMGKSAAGMLLTARGVLVVDTDTLARRETEPGSRGLEQIVEKFGPGMLYPDGNLDRAKLASVVFGKAEAREQLESILHPRIAQAWRAQLAAWERQGREQAAVLIPLLFERSYEAEFSAVITVACTAQSQRVRLRARGWQDQEIEARNGAQLPVGDKMNRARFVIWTEGSMEAHGRQWDRVLKLVSG